MAINLSPVATDDSAIRQSERNALRPDPSKQGFAAFLDQLQKKQANKPEPGKPESGRPETANTDTRCETPERAEIQGAVLEAAQKYSIAPELLLAVIKQESGFHPKAESYCGAQGLMQLMPGTARLMGVNDSFDIKQNVDGGAKYLRQMLDKFGGDVKLALAAYNAGPDRVVQYGGIPPFEETQNYVKSITGEYKGLYQVRNYQLAFAMVTPRIDLMELNPLKITTEKSDPPPEPPYPGYQKV